MQEKDKKMAAMVPLLFQILIIIQKVRESEFDGTLATKDSALASLQVKLQHGTVKTSNFIYGHRKRRNQESKREGKIFRR